MIVNRITIVVSGVLGWIAMPFAIVTHLVGGCLIGITFGLLLIPLSLIWIVFFFAPLVALSWIWLRAESLGPLAPVCHVAVGILGVPIASLGTFYLMLVPENERDASQQKFLICMTFPFTIDFIRHQRYEQASQKEPNEGVTALQTLWSLDKLPADDPQRIAAQLEADRFVDEGLAKFGLTQERANRVADLVAEIGPYL